MADAPQLQLRNLALVPLVAMGLYVVISNQSPREDASGVLKEPSTTGLPTESGTLYGSPRLHFSGQFRALTASLNNVDTNYVVADNKNLSPDEAFARLTTENLNQGMNWSAWGSNSFTFFNARVTKAVPPMGQSPGHELWKDIFVGGSQCAISDLDVTYQQSTLYGCHFKVGNDGFNNPLFEGELSPATFGVPEIAIFKSIPAKGPAHPSDPTLGGVWQSVLKNVKFIDGACGALNDATLCGLKTAAEASNNNLAFRISVDRISTDTSTNLFLGGSVQGVIGPYTQGEPTQVTRAHHLYTSLQQINPGPENPDISTPVPAHVTVMETTSNQLHWVIDLAGSLQYVMPSKPGDKFILAKTVSLHNLVLQAEWPARSDQWKNLTIINVADMEQDDFRLVDVSLVEFFTDNSPESVNYATSRLRIVPENRFGENSSFFCPKTGEPFDPVNCMNESQWYAQEDPSGGYASFEDTRGHLMEGETMEVSVFVSKFGLKAQGVDVSFEFVPAYVNGDYMYSKMTTPSDNFSFAEMGTTADDYPRRFQFTAPLDITVTCQEVFEAIDRNWNNNATHPQTYFPNVAELAKQNCKDVCGSGGRVLPRCMLGLDSYAWTTILHTSVTPPNSHYYMSMINGVTGIAWQGSILVYHKNVSHYPVNPTWTRDILPIFRSYARLFPVMKDFIDLEDYRSVTEPSNRAALNRAFSAGSTEAHYMPVTRDLSNDAMVMLNQWLQFPAHDTPPTSVGVPPPDQWTMDILLENLNQVLLVEHTTIPLYLTALYSIRPGHLPATVNLLSRVVHQEMQHMATVCAIILALGGNLNVLNESVVPKFPATFPLGIAPGVKFPLSVLSKDTLQRFLEIEHSNQFMTDCGAVETNLTCTLTVPTESDLAERGNTVAEAYLAIREAMINLDLKEKKKGVPNGIFTGPFSKKAGSLATLQGVRPVTDITSAIYGIDFITTEGEGSSAAMKYGDDLLPSHFMRFIEIMYQGSISEITQQSQPTGNKPATYVVHFHPNPRPQQNYNFTPDVFPAKPCGEAQDKECSLDSTSCEGFDKQVSDVYVDVMNSVQGFQLEEGQGYEPSIALMRRLQIDLRFMMNPAQLTEWSASRSNPDALKKCSFMPSFRLPSDYNAPYPEN